MKSNVEKLKKLGILGTVRQRQGADNASDETYDESINEMDNSELIKQWCAWHLGNGSWWTTMKYKFDRLEDMDKESK
jgi:hypothetical protein